MEIPVTLADSPLADATLEQLLVLDKEPIRPVLNVLETFPRDQLPDVAVGLGEVLIGVELDRLDLTERVDIRATTGVAVERHKDLDEDIQLVGGQLAAFEDADTEIVVFELSHRDRPVHDLALAADEQTLAVESHRLDPEIDVGCEPAVELDLPAAVPFTKLEGREIEEPEIDRLLDLVRPLAGQQDRRDVGLDVSDLVDGVRIGPRIEEPLDHRCVIQGHRLRPFLVYWIRNVGIGHGSPLRCSASRAPR